MTELFICASQLHIRSLQLAVREDFGCDPGFTPRPGPGERRLRTVPWESSANLRWTAAKCELNGVLWEIYSAKVRERKYTVIMDITHIYQILEQCLKVASPGGRK